MNKFLLEGINGEVDADSIPPLPSSNNTTLCPTFFSPPLSLFPRKVSCRTTRSRFLSMAALSPDNYLRGLQWEISMKVRLLLYLYTFSPILPCYLCTVHVQGQLTRILLYSDSEICSAGSCYVYSFAKYCRGCRIRVHERPTLI